MRETDRFDVQKSTRERYLVERFTCYKISILDLMVADTFGLVSFFVYVAIGARASSSCTESVSPEK